MKYQFHACGHPNILGTHKTTLEFTKDTELTKRGNCIIGVSADFDLNNIKDFIKKTKNKKILITLQTISKSTKIKQKIYAEINPNFNSDKELVIRKTDFVSERTFTIKANKAACDLSRELIENISANSISFIVL